MRCVDIEWGALINYAIINECARPCQSVAPGLSGRPVQQGIGKVPEPDRLRRPGVCRGLALGEMGPRSARQPARRAARLNRALQVCHPTLEDSLKTC